VPAQRQERLEREWLPRLSAVKRAAIERLREPQDRNASLLGLALLAAALEAEGGGRNLSELEFPDRGKPALPGGSDFSIAHAAGLVACAVASTGRVGFDIEPSGAVKLAIAERVLDAPSRARLASGELSPTDVWVMKEATVKLLGRSVAALKDVRLVGERAELDGTTVWLRRVALARDYTAWLATDDADGVLEITAIEDPLPAVG
jgi:4'-phosphopantetheinyl transferase